MNRSFPTLKDAYDWCNSQISSGLKVQTSRIHADRFKPPRGLTGRYVKLFGVSPKAEKICKTLCPGGEWRVEVELPGTEYSKYGFLGFRTVQTQYHRFSVWYSRFLPYAVAMMKAEYDFNCLGIDFESINSYYGTCLGFNYIGRGDGYVEANESNGLQTAYRRIIQDDTALFDKICLCSMDVDCPSLPFQEVLNYCSAFVAVQKPDLFNKHVTCNYMKDHVRKTLDALLTYK